MDQSIFHIILKDSGQECLQMKFLNQLSVSILQENKNLSSSQQHSQQQQQHNSKLTSYFENLRTCNVISSLMGQVGSLPPTGGGVAASAATATAFSPTAAPAAASAALGADMSGGGSCAGGDMYQSGFGNYLSKLQTICTDNNSPGGGGQLQQQQQQQQQLQQQQPVYDSLKSLQSYNTALSARI